MTQQEKFSLHLAYKPIMANISIKGDILDTYTLEVENNNNRGLLNAIHGVNQIPCLRSFDQLTKPITQKDYNNGKPFVPKEHLKCNNGFDWRPELIHLCSFQNVQQLLKWHFTIGFEQGEYIEVTEENNPY